MRIATSSAAAGRSPYRRWHRLRVAALAMIITGAGSVGYAAASTHHHDAGQPVIVHQAESPNLATPVGETLSGCLIGAWIHSWEEDTEGAIVFRPAEYPFPPSRGRDGYEFQSGGILVYHGFGPADEPLTSVGEWGWHSGEEIHLVVNDPQGVYIDETLRILSCDGETLQVQRLTVTLE